MLAGKMKLRTFLGLGGGAMAAAVAGWIALGTGGEEAPSAAEDREAAQAERVQRVERVERARERTRPEAQPAATKATAEAASAPPASAPPPAPAPSGASTADADAPASVAPATVAPMSAPAAVPSGPAGFVIRRLGKDLGTKKVKDATKGKSYKVNLYQDDGKPSANRAKVDLDRDDKWDEKYTMTSGTLTRKRAPNDDEEFTVSERWDGGTWVAD
jgi:hypothetical protein